LSSIASPFASNSPSYGFYILWQHKSNHDAGPLSPQSAV